MLRYCMGSDEFGFSEEEETAEEVTTGEGRTLYGCLFWNCEADAGVEESTTVLLRVNGLGATGV